MGASNEKNNKPKGSWRYEPIRWAVAAIAMLPFGALYALSDLLYYLVRYVVRYRRNVVADNLRKAFPEKSHDEIKQIDKRFYRHFTDLLMETIKLNHVSDEQIHSRMTFDGMDIIDGYYAQGRSIVAYFSHCGNWEWVTSITLWSKFKAKQDVEFCQVYRPLRNKWFDAYFLRLRSRFNSLSFAKRTVLRDLLRMKRDGKVSITAFMSDQKPSHGDPTEVVRFLSQPTAMITGTETLARKLGDAVVYLDMYKESRGHYRVVVRDLTEEVAKTEPFGLTDCYARMLEETIRRNPSIWLWTHRRWKIPVTMPQKNDQETGSSQ